MILQPGAADRIIRRWPQAYERRMAWIEYGFVHTAHRVPKR